MNQGFSILESVISLSFAVILASTMILNFRGQLHQSVCRCESITIAAMIESARLRTINTKSSCEAALESGKFTILCEGRHPAYKAAHILNPQVKACEQKTLRMWERGAGTGETLCLENHQEKCSVTISFRGRTTVTCPK